MGANADMISVKRVDAKTIETTKKKDGKTVIKTHAVVSSDRKTRAVTFVSMPYASGKAPEVGDCVKNQWK